MTDLELYDDYAGKAMAAMLSNPKIINKTGLKDNCCDTYPEWDEDCKSITRHAFIIADDMMKARKTASREYFRTDLIETDKNGNDISSKDANYITRIEIDKNYRYDYKTNEDIL